MKKKIYPIIIIMLINLNIFSNNLPLIIEDEEKAIINFLNLLNNKLPKNIEILIYDIFLLNGPKKISQKINQNFYNIINSKRNKLKFKFKHIQEVINTRKDIDYSFIENMNEFELIFFAKYLNLDGALIGSLTIYDNEKRKVWDFNKKNFVIKKVALIQGNIFSSETDNILRFAFYFLLD